MTATAKCPPAVVLLVEDDQGDQILTQEAFQSLKVPYDLRVVSDGKEALDYLYRQGAYRLKSDAASSDDVAPRPDLILLDLNMPRVNGQQVAERIHLDSDLGRIPIVVLTTSRRKEDVLKAYGHGVTSFVTKPLELEEFVTTIQELEELLKCVLALKSLRRRTRVTNRQIHRLLRRQQQLEQMTEMVFNDHMKQIEAILGQEGGQQEAPASQQRAPQTEESSRQWVAKLAQKILETAAEKTQPAPSPAAPAVDVAELDNQPASPDTGDLLRLARALESA